MRTTVDTAARAGGPHAVSYREVQHHVNNALTAIGGHAELALGLLDEAGRGRADPRADLRTDLEAIAATADGLARWVQAAGEGPTSRA